MTRTRIGCQSCNRGCLAAAIFAIIMLFLGRRHAGEQEDAGEKKENFFRGV